MPDRAVLGRVTGDRASLLADTVAFPAYLEPIALSFIVRSLQEHGRFRGRMCARVSDHVRRRRFYPEDSGRRSRGCVRLSLNLFTCSTREEDALAVCLGPPKPGLRD